MYIVYYTPTHTSNITHYTLCLIALHIIPYRLIIYYNSVQLVRGQIDLIGK